MAEFQIRGVSDPRLAVHATSPLPTWLWSIDGTRVLWANPPAARVFGAANPTRLGEKTFGPADPHRRQVAQLAHRLSPTGAIRLERLRGFGAALGILMTCGCARLDFADGIEAVLIIATEMTRRTMPFEERLQGLVEDVETPLVAFASDGTLAGASDAAQSLFGFQSLAEAGLEQAREVALREGHDEAPLGTGRIALQRVGSRAETALIGIITPPAETKADEPPAADYERPGRSGEAPAEFALFDALDETPEPAPQPPVGTVTVPASPGDEINSAPPRSETLEEYLAQERLVQEHLVQGHLQGRRHPLRFMWQMDAYGRFSLGSDAFTRLIGVRTAANFGRPWSEIEKTFGLDPEGHVTKAVATRDTWSGIVVNWPADDGSRLPVELSGLPIHDSANNLVGYRGFGVCRDLEGLARLDALRRHEIFNDPPSADMMSSGIYPVLVHPVPGTPADQAAQPNDADMEAKTPQPTPKQAQEKVQPPMHEEMQPQANVVPFRPPGEARAPVLTAVENSAFNELARQLSARLENESIPHEPSPQPDAPEAVAEPERAEISAAPPQWLATPEPPARGTAKRDRALLDLLPTGVLIYRLDRLLYANRPFLAHVGYPSLHALEEAGGLDALYVEPGVSSASSTSDTGTPVLISASHSHGTAASAPVDARLHTITWDDQNALALIFTGAVAQAPETGAPAMAAAPAPAPAVEPSAVGHANAEELATILDTFADGILMFDAEGNINSCNRSAEALFGHDGTELTQRNLASLIAPESQAVVPQYLESLKDVDAGSPPEHSREVLGRMRGGLVPLSMTLGRTQARGPNFFAVFRDLSPIKNNENELREARRLADRAANAKADLIARISHEVRTPLNAIIGFAEVMAGERFGPVGNERYAEYLKDIRISGERVLGIINDLTNLSRIETGKLDLAFADQNLNDVVENCVAVMQPQASRERIIIRTSLSHMLPPVMADAHALRQIAMNLIGNSIHLANAGGQVIVSTALTDFGEAVLRVRDTGQGLNDNEVAAAMEPFRTSPPDQAPEAAVSLSLTKALAEANRAQFNIKTGTRSGTLIEVVFPRAKAGA